MVKSAFIQRVHVAMEWIEEPLADPIINPRRRKYHSRFAPVQCH